MPSDSTAVTPVADAVADPAAKLRRGILPRRWVLNGLPVATSLAVHVGLLLLGVIALRATLVLKHPVAEQLTVPDANGIFDDRAPASGLKGPAGLPGMSGLRSHEDAVVSPGSPQLDNAIAKGVSSPMDVLGRGDATGDPHTAQIGLPGGSQSGDGTFGPSGTGGDNGTGNLFHVDPKTNVRSIVYVCDGSGSLMGGKDEALRVQLKKTIGALSPRQAFNVLVFQEDDQGHAFTALNSSMLMAHTASKGKLFDFVDNRLSFHGSTNPIPAMEEAFREKPDLIFLLTDGDFQDPDSATVRQRIAMLNKNHKVRINTVLLLKDKHEKDLYPDFEKVMKQMASENGGIFSRFYADDF